MNTRSLFDRLQLLFRRPREPMIEMPELCEIVESPFRDALTTAVELNNHEAVQHLLDNKVSPDTIYNFPVLIIAANRGCLSIVEILLEAKADINIRDFVGETAIFWAASNGKTDITKSLLSHGADCKIINYRSNTVLDEAVNKKHLSDVYLLVKHGAPFTNHESLRKLLKESDQRDPLVFEILSELIKRHTEKAVFQEHYNELIKLKDKLKFGLFESLDYSKVGQFFPSVLLNIISEYDRGFEHLDAFKFEDIDVLLRPPAIK